MPEPLLLNPYNLAESDAPAQIRITCDYQLPGEVYGHQWQGVVLVPTNIGRDWESVAVDAFVHAKKLGGLQAPMLSLCHFSYYDAATQDWVPFLEA